MVQCTWTRYIDEVDFAFGIADANTIVDNEAGLAMPVDSFFYGVWEEGGVGPSGDASISISQNGHTFRSVLGEGEGEEWRVCWDLGYCRISRGCDVDI
jgi:hypothetical protein